MNFKNTKKWFKRRKGAKHIDIQKSAEVFQEDFYLYFPSPEVDLDQYKDEDDNIDLDAIPDDQVMEFKCRYLNPGEFELICSNDQKLNLANVVDVRKLNKLSQEELDKEADAINGRILQALQNQLLTEKSTEQIAYEIAYTALIEPAFESVEQLKSILPLTIIDIITDEAVKFTDGSNLKVMSNESD